MTNSMEVLYPQNLDIKKNNWHLLNCCADTPYDYAKNSSKLENLYDIIEIKDKKVISNGKETLILVEEDANGNCYKPLFRIFGVDSSNNKKLLGTILDNFHGCYDLFDEKGKAISGMLPNTGSENSSSRRIWVKDNVLTAQVQDMNNLKKVDICGSPTTIEYIDYNGKFNSIHRNVFNNMVDYVRALLAGAGDVDKDVIQNTHKYTTFEDITPQAIQNSGLLDKNSFYLKNNSTLVINSELLEGHVPLLKDEVKLKNTAQNPLFIRPGFAWYRPSITLHFSNGVKQTIERTPAVLDEQAHVFIKCVCRYLSELNKVITSSNLNYLSMIQKMLGR